MWDEDAQVKTVEILLQHSRVGALKAAGPDDEQK